MFVIQSFKRNRAVVMTLLLSNVFQVSAVAQRNSTSATNLNELGLESGSLAQRIGMWDVTETVWSSPTASPVTTKGLIAERALIGTLLQEKILQPGSPATTSVKRTDLLSYDRLEGRWAYVSFDTRVPVGLMPAWSTGRSAENTITLIFSPFAVPSAGGSAVGQFILMEQIIRFEAPDHDVKDQYFALADGTGTRWLAHRYEYARRP